MLHQFNMAVAMLMVYKSHEHMCMHMRHTKMVIMLQSKISVSYDTFHNLQL